MEKELILLDTSVLIDYFRKTNKEKTLLYELVGMPFSFAVSVITEFEILIGSEKIQKDFWNEFFSNVHIIEFGRFEVVKAVEIYKDLKSKNQLIEIPDLLIGATAMSKKIKIATLNGKHIKRIDGLIILGQE